MGCTMSRFEHAITAGDTAAVDELLASGSAAPDTPLGGGLARSSMSPLAVACGGREVEKTHQDVRKSLTRSSIEVEKTLKRISGVQAAADTVPERWDIVERLLDAGVDLDGCPGGSGATPLMCAAELGHTQVVRALLRRGAAVDARDANGGTALLRAAALGQTGTMEALLAAGADADVADKDGVTPVMAAVLGGQAEALWALLAAGAAPGRPRHCDGAAPLHLAAAAGRADMVSALMASGAPADAINARGETPAHVAAAMGRTAALTALGRGGANMAARDARGWTPLMAAIGAGEIPAATALLSSHHVDIGVKAMAKDGTTAMGLAVALEEKGECLIYMLMTRRGDPYALAGRRASSPPTTPEQQLEGSRRERAIAGVIMSGDLDVENAKQGEGDGGEGGEALPAVQRLAAGLEQGALTPEEVLGEFL